jgi:hypothetical protein
MCRTNYAHLTISFGTEQQDEIVVCCALNLPTVTVYWWLQIKKTLGTWSVAFLAQR